MDIQETSTPETTTTVTDAVTPPPGAEQAASGATPPEGAQTPSAEGTETPAYTPNYKYKAFGKEGEIDEWARGAIKDAESEKKARELYERAAAFDDYKGKNEDMQNAIESRYKPIAQAFINVANAYKANDFDSVFKQLKIDEKAIYNWVAEKIRYQELPEQEKARYIEEKNTRTRAASLERENQILSERQRDYEVQARSFELDQGLAKPEVKAAADAYDAIYGAGAFKMEVVRTGQYHASVSGRDLGVAEVLSEMVSRAQPLVSRLSQGQVASQSPVQSPTKLPVIPNPQGGSSSAVKPVVKTMTDIKARLAAMEASTPG